MATSSAFILEFHNLKGVTIGERRKNLQSLLRNKLTADEIQSVLNNLKPKTYLESKLYIDILIHLKRKTELLEVLKQGHEPFINIILKQHRLLQEIFNNNRVDEQINELLPAMPFTVKKKLLKKLCLIVSENEMDQVFDSVLKRYGLFLATTVIPGCTSKKIENILKYNEVELSSKQLKMLYNKQSSLINVYVEQHKQQPDMIFDDNFLTYIAQKDPTFFFELIATHGFTFNLRLGRRTTKKVIKIRKPEIVSNPNKYIEYLRHETLVRTLNNMNEFKDFYYNLFPRDIEVLDRRNGICVQLLKYYPKRYRYGLFAQTFNAIIKEDVSCYISCLDDDLLEVIENETWREKLGQLKYKECFDDEYIKYYTLENSLAIIKEKLGVTASIKERNKLLCVLVKSCAINKDLNALEKALKYFCEKHRNDDKTIRDDFLKTVETNFNIDNLRETHWKYINEICTIQTLNKEHCQHKLRINYIKFLYQNNASKEDIRNAILQFVMNEVIAHFSFFSSISSLKDPKIERDILLATIENLPRFMKDLLGYSLSKIFSEIFSYNLRYPQHKIVISEHNDLVVALNRTLEGDYVSRTLKTQIAKEICKLKRDEFDNKILNDYLEKPWVENNLVLCWYLKYDPVVIVQNFEKIIKSLTVCNSFQNQSTICNIWSKIKLYSHLHLDNMAIQYCLKQLNSKDNNQINVIKVLSLLCTEENYIAIMTEGNFIPTSPKLAIEDQEAREMYELQQVFVKNLKNVKDPLKYLDILLDKFCRGDYLQAALPSLYSVFYRCPEDKLQVYIEKLSTNQAISVRKHSIFLACVFDQQTILKILQQLAKGERNVSLQKHMFSSTIKYFSKNPTDEVFENVISFIKLLKQHDTESLKLLFVAKICNKYKPSYIRSIWDLLQSFKLNSIECENTAFNTSLILDLVDQNCIQKLPEDFCKEIIHKNFLTPGGTYSSKSGILSFVIKYLVYRNDTNSNYRLVFGLLSNYKSQTWDDACPKKRNVIYNFFSTFYTLVCEKKLYSDVVQFASRWTEIFTPMETFEEYILLNLLQFKDADIGLELYSQQIVLFSEKIYAQFGQIVFTKFIKILAKHLKTVRINSVDLLSSMLKFKTSSSNCIMVIELISLKGNLFYKDEIKPIYQEINTILNNISDPDVQLYYNLYLKIK